MKKRFVALILSLLIIMPIIPHVTATETVSCLTVDNRLLIIGDGNTVSLKKNNPDIQPAIIYSRNGATIEETIILDDNNTADGYSYCIAKMLLTLNSNAVDTVIINIGTNDLGSPTKDFKFYYKKLMEKLYAQSPNAVIYCCKILPVNPNHYLEQNDGSITIENVAIINNVVVEVQQEFKENGYDARILDLNTPFSNANGELLSKYDSDGIHLNTSGYKYMNKVIQTELAKGNQNADHSWVAGQILQPVTCTVDGVQQMDCTVCGAKKEIILPATGHMWDAGTITVAPTCISTGIRVYGCASCGETRSETIPIDPNAHAWKLKKTLTEGEIYHDSIGLYTCSLCQTSKEARLCAGEIFKDIPKDSYWSHGAIDWAYFNGVTAGTSATTFSPKGVVTRGQVVTFLYAYRNRPETTVRNPFSDVREKDYYFYPVLWAYEKNITAGSSENTFSPGASCLREQMLTFLWGVAGKPQPTIENLPYDDINKKAYYYNAARWACESNITAGIAPNTFGIGIKCTREQMVNFLWALYRYETKLSEAKP